VYCLKINCSSPTSAELEGRYSICLPSISTAVFEFDEDRAVSVASGVFAKFLNQFPLKNYPYFKICLVDITESSVLKKFKDAQEKIKDPRFSVAVASLTELKSKNMPSWFIVNASNPKFKPTGSGTNKWIHNACTSWLTPSLEELTLQLYEIPARVSVPYPVPLPVGCPLRNTQNVHYVIHVVGPNMNPKRDNCLNGDYEKGEKLLRQSYESVLDVFVRKIL